MGSCACLLAPLILLAHAPLHDSRMCHRMRRAGLLHSSVSFVHHTNKNAACLQNSSCCSGSHRDAHSNSKTAMLGGAFSRDGAARRTSKRKLKEASKRSASCRYFWSPSKSASASSSGFGTSAATAAATQYIKHALVCCQDRAPSRFASRSLQQKFQSPAAGTAFNTRSSAPCAHQLRRRRPATAGPAQSPAGTRPPGSPLGRST